MTDKKIILIGGPTASGKSALAMQMARQRPSRIINADAMQIYAGLPVLTAQPTASDRAETPHILYETDDAAEAFSVGKWLILAQKAIHQAHTDHITPIVVGGTGLYFQALLNGLADIPAIPDTVRAATTALYEKVGEQEFRAALAGIDPASASRIARNDRQRLIRAFEVASHTGKALSLWQAESTAQGTEQNKLYEKHVLLPPRDTLYNACNARFLKMIEQGALDEVHALMVRDLSPALPAMKILGVREIAAHLHGELSLAAAITASQQATRNYAKRQMTWFRNQWGAKCDTIVADNYIG